MKRLALLAVFALAGCQSGYQYQAPENFTPVPYTDADVAEVQRMAADMTPEKAQAINERTADNREYFEAEAQAEARAAAQASAVQAAYERQAMINALGNFAAEAQRQQQQQDYEFYQRQEYYQQVQQTYQLQQINNSLNQMRTGW